MSSPLSFHSFVGNRRVVAVLIRALGQDRLPHALVFAGPPGVGKRTLGQLLAQYLNCLQPANGESCNLCINCRKIMSGNHPDLQIVQPEGAFIKIDQVRGLNREIAFQPFEGSYRVVILDGADQMQKYAQNCLLKTLEEPPSRSILILVTSKPYLLLDTIRSRSRVLQFGAIAEDLVAKHLVDHEGRTPDDARLAAVCSNGSLGAALAFDATRNREIRGQAFAFIRLLLQRGRFAQASAQAAGIVKEKESFPAWVEMANTLLQDVYYAQVAPQRIAQIDIAGDLAGLAQATPHPAVVSAIKSFQDLKAALLQNANRQLALEALFLAETGRS